MATVDIPGNDMRLRIKVQSQGNWGLEKKYTLPNSLSCSEWAARSTQLPERPQLINRLGTPVVLTYYGMDFVSRISSWSKFGVNPAIEKIESISDYKCLKASNNCRENHSVSEYPRIRGKYKDHPPDLMSDT
jgi:hypothetical protein